MATKKFSEYAIEGNNITLTYDNVNDTVTFDVNVDKNDVGLGNVDNTSDLNKPISTATQTALDGKASTTALTTHTSDLNNPHAVTKTQIGLGNVDNTSDLNKPISTATQTALNAKQDSLGFTAENVANKSISVTTDQSSNTKYPSVKAVYDWAIGAFQPILGFTPVNNARTLTINGTTYDLSANRTWSVGDLFSTGSYANPTWLTSLAWGKVTGTPTTLSGYGITDAVPSSRTLTINGTSYDLSADRSWTVGTSALTLAQVTTNGNTTTNSISVGAITSIYSDNSFNQGVTIKNTNTGTQALVGVLLQNSAGTGVGQFSYVPTNYIDSTLQNTVIFSSYGLQKLAFIANATNTGTGGSDIYFKTRASNTNGIILFGSTQNVGINTTTDAGYKLDVNGTTRLNGALTLGMTPIAAASVVSTHKLQITIAGTTYYLLASNI